MSIVVFLSNINLQVAVGSSSATGIKVSKLFSAPLPEGAVLNGVVMDQDLLTQAIKTAWELNKLPKQEITLIINSPQLRATRLNAPIASDHKTTEYIRREIAQSDYGRFQKPVTGWYAVKKNSKAKTVNLITETAETDFVSKYVEIFDKVGLKLKSIHNGVQLAAEFFAKQVAGKTVIYMILDGNSLVTIFFAEGKYYYDSTLRVFSQPGTPEFAREIYSSISSIRQFISAQHLNQTVKDVIFAGVTQQQVNTLVNDILNIDSQVDISMAQPPSGTTISNSSTSFPFYVYPISGLRKVDEKLSILKASKESSKKQSSSKGIIKIITPFIIATILALMAFVGLQMFKLHREDELKAIKKYNNDPEVLAQVAEYDAMYDSMEDIGTIQGGIDILNNDISTYPIPDSDINDRILDAAEDNQVDITFDSYNADTGVFSITASASTVDNINMFIADLLNMDIFENVDYTGYTLNRDGTAWTINVVCYLASPDPAETTTDDVTADDTDTEEIVADESEINGELQVSIEEVSAIIVDAYGDNFIEIEFDENMFNNDSNREQGVLQLVSYAEQGDWSTTEGMYTACCMVIEMDMDSDLYLSLEVGQDIPLIRSDNGMEVPCTITAINGQYVLCAYDYYFVDETPISHTESPFFYEGLDRAVEAFTGIENPTEEEVN